MMYGDKLFRTIHYYYYYYYYREDKVMTVVIKKHNRFRCSLGIVILDLLVTNTRIRYCN